MQMHIYYIIIYFMVVSISLRIRVHYTKSKIIRSEKKDNRKI